MLHNVKLVSSKTFPVTIMNSGIVTALNKLITSLYGSCNDVWLVSSAWKLLVLSTTLISSLISSSSVISSVLQYCLVPATLIRRSLNCSADSAYPKPLYVLLSGPIRLLQNLRDLQRLLDF